MTSDHAQTQFNPRTVLVGLQRREVDFVLIGGLARVARGADEVTRGVDICPSVQPINLGRLQAALIDLGALSLDVVGGPPMQFAYDEARLRAEQVVALPTVGGELKLVAAPAGVPRGYDALRAGATSEHLGSGLRIEIASTADLITMAAALRRPEDLERLPALRQILRLEADPARLVESPARRTPTPQELARTRPYRAPGAPGGSRGDPGVGR
jgi:hypothetical protein